jgi:hypothetical protein
MKIVKIEIGDKVGCSLNDKIIIELSPSYCKYMESFFRKASEDCTDYNLQKHYHEITEFFKECFSKWREKRESKIEDNEEINPTERIQREHEDLTGLYK